MATYHLLILLVCTLVSANRQALRRQPQGFKVSVVEIQTPNGVISLNASDHEESWEPLEDLPTELQTVVSASGVHWLHNVYNPQRWGPKPPAGLGPDCENHLEVYLRALLNSTGWAAKMSDASGRYSSEFFFGNDFWLGSYKLCREMEEFDSPPFAVAFHVAKLQISLAKNLTPMSRRILLGLCLPQSCTASDITSLLHPGEYGENTLQVLHVRSVPGEYNVLLDVKLHILGGVLAVLTVLITVGTCYEMLQSRDHDDNQTPETEKPSSPGLVSQLLLSFSALKNGRKILHCGTPEESLTSVHGLRFLSLAWVILVHTYLQVFAIAENKTLRTLTERNFMFQTVSNATFSVDTFFFISGLLVTFLYFRSSKKSSHEVNTCNLMQSTLKFLQLMLYRFIRLTPAYLYVLGMVEVAMRYLHNRSVFEPKIMDHLNCENYWWRNALYINSLFPRKEMCMLWSWYMANDTQFYVVGILLLLISVKHLKAVAAVWGLFLVSSWGTTAFISYKYNYLARIQEPFAQFDALYDKPWTRLGPYLVGMGTGWLLHYTKCNIKMPIMAVLSGWAFALLCLMSLVYGLSHVQLGVYASAAYVSLGHTAWGLSLAWIVVACCTGHGGVINTFLSWKALYPLSRLTYCAYLTHPLIMVLTGFSIDGPIHLHNLLIFILYLGNMVAAFVLSFFLSLAFEAPIVNLLKITMKTS